MNISVVVGNPTPQSRTLTIALRVAQELVPGCEPFVVDLAAHTDSIFDQSSAELTQISETVARSALVIVASPTYKASYTGLLKAFLDRYPNNALSGVCAVPLMTGGSPHHSMAPSLTLHPLLAELGASVPCRSLYVDMQKFDAIDDIVETWASSERPIVSAALNCRQSA
ncbi:hypothetical protein B2J88_02895 [Rhodococcus sp. SRB_17]|nr:hypothetical protein [Rhodococcus sp. SRB_17]